MQPRLVGVYELLRNRYPKAAADRAMETMDVRDAMTPIGYTIGELEDMGLLPVDPGFDPTVQT